MSATELNQTARPLRVTQRNAADAIALPYRLAGRVLRWAIIRQIKAHSARELRSISPRIRADIGVPEHAIDDIATELAIRRVDAWMKQVMLAA